MKLSNAILHDLLLLVKAHYGPFNDLNMVERIARLLESHYQIGLKQTRKLEFQVRVLTAALLSIAPNYLVDKEEKFIDLLTTFAKDPKDGHNKLVGMLSMLPVDGSDPDVPVITLPKPSERMRSILDKPIDEAVPT